MLSMTQAKKLWATIKSNSKKLASCDTPHDFSIKHTQLKGKWKCSKCNGIVTNESKYWYEKGLKDGSRR